MSEKETTYNLIGNEEGLSVSLFIFTLFIPPPPGSNLFALTVTSNGRVVTENDAL